MKILNKTSLPRYIPSALVLLYFSFPVYTVSKLGMSSVFNYFAADTFYYLSIAKKAPLLWNSTDGISRTNGFHPLWQNLLNIIYQIFDPSDSMFIYLVFFISLGMIGVGYLVSADVCQKISMSNISWIFLFPGMVYICGSQATTSEYGVSNIYQPFSFINGMESSLTILFFGMLFVLLHKKELSSWKDWCQLGVVISIITLSRLDDVFLLFGFIVYLVVSHRQDLYRKLVALCSPVAIALVALFGYHLMTGQSLMPVSGSIKGTDTGEFESNFVTLKRILIPGNTLEPVTTRAYGLFIPLLLALIFLALLIASRWMNKGQNVKGVEQLYPTMKYLVPLSVYVISKSTYTYFSFYLIETGYWYYVGPVICMNFLAAILIGIYLDKNIFSKILLVGFFSLIQIFNVSYTYQKLQTDNLMFTVFDNRQKLQKNFDDLFGVNAKFIDGTDGIYSYIFRNPSQSARGFTANREGYQAFQNDGYVGYYKHLLSKDFRILVGLDVYTHPVPRTVKVIFKYRDESTGTVFSLLEEIP